MFPPAWPRQPPSPFFFPGGPSGRWSVTFTSKNEGDKRAAGPGSSCRALWSPKPGRGPQHACVQVCTRACVPRICRLLRELSDRGAKCGAGHSPARWEGRGRALLAHRHRDASAQPAGQLGPHPNPGGRRRPRGSRAWRGQCPWQQVQWQARSRLPSGQTDRGRRANLPGDPAWLLATRGSSLLIKRTAPFGISCVFVSISR